MKYPKGARSPSSYPGVAAGNGIDGVDVVIAIIRGLISFGSLNETPTVNKQLLHRTKTVGLRSYDQGNDKYPKRGIQL